MIYDCIITGGGASGLFCAANTKLSGKGLILEKTLYPGTKLLMSGNGQCNITHSGPIKDFVPCYGENGSKIRTCLYKSDNRSLISFLKDNGIPVTIRNDGKVFPASMKARDILKMLIERSTNNGFELICNQKVLKISPYKNLWELKTGKESYLAKTVVIATGGCSYPATGSDGSFFKVLKKDLDISVTSLRPALASIQVEGYLYSGLSGISFDNVNLSIYGEGKKALHSQGSFLFTHRDFSGPAILNISKYAHPGDKLKINYMYPMDFTQVSDILKSLTYGNKSRISTLLSSSLSLPKRFAQILTENYGNSLKKLSSVLTGEEFIIKSTSGFNKAMATSGGIELSQINTSTMEFKKYPRLFAIGEALDIDGITGGYNIQFAYSSAKAASSQIENHIKTL